MTRLLVCWTAPDAQDGRAPLLSFLAPAAEEKIAAAWRGPFLRAREASLAARAQARDAYLALAAKIGAAPFGGGTFRQALTRPGGSSLWWYHPSSFKDCESDPAFEWLIAARAIAAEAKKVQAEGLELWGAPEEMVRALAPLYPIEARRTRPAKPALAVALRALASRAKQTFVLLRQTAAARGLAAAARSFDVALVGFWDWSFWWNEKDGDFEDRYFKRLPKVLRAQGTSVGWFAWLDAQADPGKRGRPLDRVLAPLRARGDAVILQSFLGFGDVLRAAADFRPLAAYLALRARKDFRGLFRADGCDYYPFFAEKLLRGFADASLARFSLAALAVERACRRLRPKTLLSFLEHFPHARACYEGVRRAGLAIRTGTIQHASYGREKTFLFLDPALEMRGEPDRCAAPHPQQVYAMGTLGRELFLACGYARDQVALTGSPRYDDDAAPDVGLPPARKVPVVLVAASLDMELEVEMLEAFCAAARGLTLKRVWRDHPFNRLALHPRFAEFKDEIEVSAETLERDIARADLVLFTYSTVAEQALLRGKPAWQWLPLKFNGSALAEAVAIPRHASVESLRRGLAAFCADPAPFIPSPQARLKARERLFHPADGQAAERIARSLQALIAQAPA